MTREPLFNTSKQRRLASLFSALGALTGSLIVFVVMYFWIIGESRKLMATVKQENTQLALEIAAHQHWQKKMLEEKAIYELSNTQNLALIAKLRGFCGKPCAGVE